MSLLKDLKWYHDRNKTTFLANQWDCMSEFSGHDGARTRFTASIELTAREKQAVERFLNRATVEGDVALVESVMRLVILNATIEANDPNPPSTDLHRE